MYTPQESNHFLQQCQEMYNVLYESKYDDAYRLYQKMNQTFHVEYKDIMVLVRTAQQDPILQTWILCNHHLGSLASRVSTLCQQPHAEAENPEWTKEEESGVYEILDWVVSSMADEFIWYMDAIDYIRAVYLYGEDFTLPIIDSYDCDSLLCEDVEECVEMIVGPNQDCNQPNVLQWDHTYLTSISTYSFHYEILLLFFDILFRNIPEQGKLLSREEASTCLRSVLLQMLQDPKIRTMFHIPEGQDILTWVFDVTNVSVISDVLQKDPMEVFLAFWEQTMLRLLFPHATFITFDLTSSMWQMKTFELIRKIMVLRRIQSQFQ